ncbi:hypothetical protein FHR33_000385 [Nonomuraea dietziae]|uniref:Uncharacterized protein n=1 Tax=Nonomuraea dietziae TaxID=65515 RepID=A0A7W5V3X4_9ACTN|nr:hypothetical protein [Nonomuraea dietziae]
MHEVVSTKDAFLAAYRKRPGARRSWLLAENASTTSNAPGLLRDGIAVSDDIDAVLGVNECANMIALRYLVPEDSRSGLPADQNCPPTS